MLRSVILIVVASGLVLAYPNKRIVSKTNSYKSEQDKVGIYNGNSTTISNHRYLVGILKNGQYLCAGSIVSASWVITSADCTNNHSPSDLTVVGSSEDGVTGGVNYTVAQIVPHPDYGKDKMDYDYSCVQISKHFYYYARRMLKLPSVEPADNTMMTVAGYGYTDSSYSTRSLSEIYMTWLPKDTCENTYKKFDFTWTDRLACADNTNGASLCKGDYGDAFVVDRVIYGMFVGSASSGFCTSSAEPAILADIYPAIEWIQSTTGAEFA